MINDKTKAAQYSIMLDRALGKKHSYSRILISTPDPLKELRFVGNILAYRGLEFRTFVTARMMELANKTQLIFQRINSNNNFQDYLMDKVFYDESYEIPLKEIAKIEARVKLTTKENL